jgi:hypothetical protein
MRVLQKTPQMPMGTFAFAFIAGVLAFFSLSVE